MNKHQAAFSKERYAAVTIRERRASCLAGAQRTNERNTQVG
jgi:hypothetical protein